MEADLKRLTDIVQTTRTRRLVIPGDWIHAAVGCTPYVVDAIRRWRDLHAALAVTWIKGNHDHVPAEVTDQFAFHEMPWMDDGPFRFHHDPIRVDRRFTIGGHEHPTMRLWTPGMPRLTAPCFHLTPERLVLLAFGSFTGGHQIAPEHGRRVFVIAERVVVEWPISEISLRSRAHRRLPSVDQGRIGTRATGDNRLSRRHRRAIIAGADRTN